jgi:hypothetical protein
MTTCALLNGRICTLDRERPSATALAVSDGRVVAVGDDDAVRTAVEHFSRPGPPVAEYDLGGRLVVPGLIDAHVHFSEYAIGLQSVAAETATLDECLARVAARAAATPKGEWVTGQGWNQNPWGRYPTAADLDRVAADHPVYLESKSWHAGWVNSLALRLAGIDETTPDPPGGQIQRDAAGRPTGVLLEDAASGLVKRAMPELSTAALAALLRPAVASCWRVGLTGVHDFDGERAREAMEMLRGQDEPGLRFVSAVLAEELEAALAQGLHGDDGDDWLRTGAVKVMIDGALSQATAWMWAPYEGLPEQLGMALIAPDDLFALGTRARAGGFAMAVHAIGDRANHEVLDVFARLRAAEAAEAEAGVTAREAGALAHASAAGAQRAAAHAGLRVPAHAARLRHRIEHVQLLRPDDYDRLAQLGVIASMQPVHAPSDMMTAERRWRRRCAGAYALHTQLAAGATLACGSDAPVEGINPLWGIHAAVTRRRADGSPGPDGWHPEQRLTVEEALRGFTLGAAYAAGMEGEVGSLAPGKLADLVVLDRDIFNVDPMAIRGTVVLGTMVGGEWRYRDL